MCSWSSNTHKECAADFFLKLPFLFLSFPLPNPSFLFSLNDHSQHLNPNLDLYFTTLIYRIEEITWFKQTKKKTERRRKRREKISRISLQFVTALYDLSLCIHDFMEKTASEQEITRKERNFFFSFAKGIIWDSSASVARLGFHSTDTIKVKLIYLDVFFCTAASIWHECALNTEYWSSYLLSRKKT